MRLYHVIIFIIVGLNLSSCGFRPMYEKSTNDEGVSFELAAINVIPQKIRLGQEFANLIEDELNPTGIFVKPKYELSFTMEKTFDPIAIQDDNAITRYNTVLNVRYSLKEKGLGKDITIGSVRMRSSYDAVISSNFATIMAQENSVKNVMKEISKEIKNRMILVFKNPNIISKGDLSPKARGKFNEDIR